MGIVCTGTTCYKFDPEGGLVLNHYVYKTPTIDDHNGGAIVNWKGTPLFVGGRGTLGPGFHTFFFAFPHTFEKQTLIGTEHLWWTETYPFPANFTGYQPYPGFKFMNGKLILT